ncbi:hypothetical protein P8625_04790 [Tenacibaculum tangerinum]|uniref:HTH luxR-type domain-containing protein n=1 Tax=Tenacibaculum tangerinum TaxID=3038772 RepID=A0ABY8L4X7_9FLAO|nr:hypothetical protein [Tenacibaculum tangerinum]WGH76481.1 hypothetical protein P8625_04790 [Tenacibaculum tangerinum]
MLGIPLPKKTTTLVKAIKEVEYTNGDLLISEAKKLQEQTDSLSKHLSDYYMAKGEFLKYYTYEKMEAFESFYKTLEAMECYSLMAEIDLLTTYFHYTYNAFDKAAKKVKRSEEYCFKPSLELEREALIYGISPTVLVNTPQEKKEEITYTLERITRKYPWSIYHSRIASSLAITYYYSGEYETAKTILLETIEKNKALSFNLELSRNYTLLSVVESQLSGDFEKYIAYELLSADYKKEYGNQYLSINYRTIGHRYFNKELYEDAFKYYQLAVESEGSDIASKSVDYAYLGWAYFHIDKKKNAPKAMEYYNKGLTYNNENHIGYKLILERKMWTLDAIGEKEKAAAMKVKVLEARANVENKSSKKRFEDFKINYLLSLKSKNNRLEKLQQKSELNAVQIERQRFAIIALVVFTLLMLVILMLSYKNAKNYKTIKKLNVKLKESITTIETRNEELTQKNEENLKLLEINQRSLFTKTFKVSTYKDAIDNVVKEISNALEEDTSMSAKQLRGVKTQLKTILNEDEIWQDFKLQFERTRPSFFKKLLDISPNLSVNDLKHCAYISLNLKTKEVATLINISPRSVETARYRLKRKLNLGTEDNLSEFLNKL